MVDMANMQGFIEGRLWGSSGLTIQGSKLKKSLGCLLVTNWRILVARCKFHVTSLCNPNVRVLFVESVHVVSEIQSLLFSGLFAKFCSSNSNRIAENIANKSPYLTFLCHLAHFFMTNTMQDKIRCLFEL